MKVVLASLMNDEFLKDLTETFPDVDFAVANSPDDQQREIRDADVFFGMPSRDVFVAGERLRWLQIPGTGVDKAVEIPELVDSDVVLTNARGPHTNPMADHVMAAILAHAHRIGEMLGDQRKHHWHSEGYVRRIVELEGTRMGVMAMGDIGRAVALRAAAFGIEVYAVDILAMGPPPGVREVWPVERLDEMLGMVDWLVVTTPLTAATSGMVDRRRLSLLKEGAFVVVVSRGGIVDEEALVAGLHSGKIGGAALDVTAVEPLPEDSPLWDAPNMWISPHVSAESVQLIERRKAIFKENLRRYLAAEELLHVCDTEKGY